LENIISIEIRSVFMWRRCLYLKVYLPCIFIAAVAMITSCSPPLKSTNLYSANIGTLIFVPAGKVPSIRIDYDGNSADFCTMPAIHMSSNDITRQEWVNVTGLPDPSDSSVSSGMNDPVQNVNWYMAVYFCNKLSIKEGLTPVYSIIVNGAADTNPDDWLKILGGTFPNNFPISGNNATWDAVQANWSADGYRLPTEMEWLWAAMGATRDSRRADFSATGVNTKGYNKGYAGSQEPGTACSNISLYAWINKSTGTHAVGLLKPNELGLCDMSGNVYQWCWEWWVVVYPDGMITDPVYTFSLSSSTGYRVIRGGAWNSVTSCGALDDSSGGGDGPCSGGNSIGFRVVRP
jgi:formylglycine-generating enzyme required for sulfatase activity